MKVVIRGNKDDPRIKLLDDVDIPSDNNHKLNILKDQKY